MKKTLACSRQTKGTGMEPNLGALPGVKPGALLVMGDAGQQSIRDHIRSRTKRSDLVITELRHNRFIAELHLP